MHVITKRLTMAAEEAPEASTKTAFGAVAKWLGIGLQNRHTWVQIPSAPLKWLDLRWLADVQSSVSATAERCSHGVSAPSRTKATCPSRWRGRPDEQLPRGRKGSSPGATARDSFRRWSRRWTQRLSTSPRVRWENRGLLFGGRPSGRTRAIRPRRRPVLAARLAGLAH